MSRAYILGLAGLWSLVAVTYGALIAAVNRQPDLLSTAIARGQPLTPLTDASDPVRAYANRLKRYAGCYRLDADKWDPRGGPTLPKLVRLDPVLLAPPWGSGMNLQARPGLRTFRWQWPPRWRLMSGPDVQLAWSNGFEGVIVDFYAQGDTLKGIARVFTDVIASENDLPLASVNAVRVHCTGLGS